MARGATTFCNPSGYLLIDVRHSSALLIPKTTRGTVTLGFNNRQYAKRTRLVRASTKSLFSSTTMESYAAPFPSQCIPLTLSLILCQTISGSLDWPSPHAIVTEMIQQQVVQWATGLSQSSAITTKVQHYRATSRQTGPRALHPHHCIVTPCKRST